MDERSDSSFPFFCSDIIEVGECRVQKGFRVVIKEECENNKINEGDIIIVYIKKKKLID